MVIIGFLFKFESVSLTVSDLIDAPDN